MMTQMRAVWAIVKKDVRVWVRNPIRIVVTAVPALVLLLILVLQGAAVQGYPVAIVNHGHGRAAMQFQQDAQHYPGFIRAPRMSAPQAQKAYARLQVAAVLTIPSHFSRAIAQGQHPILEWQIRNFNNDSGNDLRRFLPDIVTAFLAQHVIGPNPLHIHVAETDLHHRQVGFISFELIAVLVVLLLQASLVSSGLATVSEWESGSMKELLVSPASPLAIAVGKVLAGVLVSDLVGGATIGLAGATGLLPGLTSDRILEALAITTLLAVFGSGVGVALASTLRTTEKTSLSALLLAFYLFFISGGIAAFAYLPGWVQAIARFVPNTYAVDALRNTLLYGTAAGMGRDLGILSLSAGVGIALGLPAIRRGLAH